MGARGTSWAGLGAVPIGAVPIGAVLIGAVLIGAVLIGAVLIGAVLIGAVPIGAALIGAVLIGAVPIGAVPIGAALIGAGLGAVCQGTGWVGIRSGTGSRALPQWTDVPPLRCSYTGTQGVSYQEESEQLIRLCWRRRPRWRFRRGGNG